MLSVGTALSVASCGVGAWRIVVAHSPKCPADASFNAAVIVQIAMAYDGLATEDQVASVRRHFHQMYTPRAFKDAEYRLCGLLGRNWRAGYVA